MGNLNWKNGICGIGMRPCSTTNEHNDTVMHSTDYSVKSNFLQEYNNHIAAMEIVAECAKIYILNNWEKVIDWSNLNVVVTDGRGGKYKPVEYFNYVKRERKKQGVKSSGLMNDILASMDATDKKKHNPIVSLNDVVLDPTDGDFSLTINGKEHFWISDDSVIVIAAYVEQQLNPK